MTTAKTLELFRQVSSNSDIRYRVVQPLGIGGNSEVYLVEAMTGESQGLLFALKLFVRVADGTRLGRFKQEVAFLKGCKHPAIMRVYDDGEIVESVVGLPVSYPYVIADYLPRTLFDSMRSGLSMMEKVSFVLQLLSAASYMERHAPQIVHRDIKPENIFVRGKACILGDFGLMKLLVTGEDDYLADKEFIIASSGARLPRYYRTPDLVDYCKDKVDITTKSDIFQLGLVLSEMFTGSNPLREGKAILDKVELEVLGEIPGSQSSAIRSHLNHMLQMDPSLRPSAQDLFDPWEGIFREFATISHSLEGKVF